MSRWKPHLPRYITPVILERYRDGPESGSGLNKLTNYARCLRVFDTTDVSRVTLPTVAGPATNLVSPSDFNDQANLDGWVAWWPEPPEKGGNYKIPDPPKMERPVNANIVNPVVWDAWVEVGSAVWQARISAFYARVEWVPHGGNEKISGVVNLSINMARAKIRPSIIYRAGVDALNWELRRVEDGTVWKIKALVDSYRRGEFIELHLERVEG